MRNKSIILLSLLFLLPGTAFTFDGYYQMCEQAYGVSALLMKSIAIVESGNMRRLEVITPYALNIKGNGEHLAKKSEAQKRLRQELALGHKNIDVGLFQINLASFDKHFNSGKDPISAIDLLDPKTNTLVACHIFRDLLFRSNFDVGLAISRYHSWNEEIGFPYANKVIGVYNRLVKERKYAFYK